MSIKYTDSLWCFDPYSNYTYDILVQHGKNNKSFCKTVEEFLRDRAKLEDNYGSALFKLASGSVKAEDESGSLRLAWEGVRQRTRKVGSFHIELGEILGRLADEVKDFSAELRNRLNPLENATKKRHEEFKARLKAAESLRKTRDMRMNDACSSQFEADSALKAGKPQSQVEKLVSAANRKLNEARLHDEAYQQAVVAAEDNRIVYLNAAASLMDAYETNDLQFFRFFRLRFWNYANIGSQQAFDVDGLYEEIRKSLEQCDAQEDIRAFLAVKRAGGLVSGQQPAPIVYQQPGDNWRQLLDQVSGRPASPSLARHVTDQTMAQNSQRAILTTGKVSTPNTSSTALSSQNQQQLTTQLQPQGAVSRRAGAEREQNSNAGELGEQNSSAPAPNESSPFPVGRAPLMNLVPGAPSTASGGPNSASVASSSLPSRSPGLGFLIGAVSGAHRLPLAPNRSSPQPFAPTTVPVLEPSFDPTYDNESTDM